MRANRFRSQCLLTLVFACAWMGRSQLAQAEQSVVNLRAATALVMPVTLALDDVPLKRAVESLAEQADILVVWDNEELAKMDLPGEETVALRTSQKVSFYKALCFVLEPLYLTYEEQGDSILITSRQKWGQRVVKANYDLGSIVSNQLTPDSLMQMIRAKIEQGSWQQENPDQAGYLEIVGETLLVTHRQEVQRELEHWLFGVVNIPAAN